MKGNLRFTLGAIAIAVILLLAYAADDNYFFIFSTKGI